jgi:N-acetylmuramoyl-L-alanine amidase
MSGVLELITRRRPRAAFAAASLSFVLILPAFATHTTDLKRQAAQSQFSRGEEQRAALNSKPLAERTLAEYKQVISAYRRVYLITPHAPEVPDALLAVAELNAEMGDRFGRRYFQAAVDTYQFLLHEYPASHYCSDAMLRMARLQKDQLGDPALAAKTYEEFLKRYHRSPRRREAQEALAELALLQHGELPAPPGTPKDEPARPAKMKERPAVAESAAAAPSPSASGEIPRVKGISTTITVNSTRVVVDLEAKVTYTSARIRNPDRIYFDLQAARLTPEMASRTITVSGEMLKAVRMAQNHAGIVRMVLDVSGVRGYTAAVSDNPPRLTVDLYASAAALRAGRKTRKEGPIEEAKDTSDASVQAQARAAEKAAGKPALQPAAARKISAEPAEIAAAPSAEQADSRIRGAAHDSLMVNNTSLTRSRKDGAVGPERNAGPPSVPLPTRDGQATLTRTLGLKIGRIVIDAGHGGHDTGTIGPTGLLEKDLCLDIALRLGKVIEQKLPGAEVIFTRPDDTFVPLERRTEIANEAKADLFISIHANSSHDHAARGVETYYLNLRGSAEAMDVAARENAMASGGVHELQDLVKKIARTEKIEESRELASDIQDSLAQRVQKTSRRVKNRGVRKAPFVVLIGADMPSILTEISFLSNPADEKLLKKPDYRQRVADGLYQGVASYLKSLNSVTYNLPARSAAPRPHALPASVEQSRNQQ